MKNCTTVARVLVGLPFAISGVFKVMGFAGTAGYMASVGMPFAEVLLVLTIILELGGGLAIVFGWQARHAALALAAFTVVATAIFHNDLGDQTQIIAILKNIAWIGGLIYVAETNRKS